MWCQEWGQQELLLLLLALEFLSRAMGSHGGFLSRGGAGRHEFEGPVDCPPEAASRLSPPQRACQGPTAPPRSSNWTLCG